MTIAIDAPPLDSDRARAVEVPFLGRRAGLLPGAVALAQMTGAPLLMGFVYRAADYRHQVLEISAPVPVEGETGDGIRALRRRGERRHPEEPGPLGILGEHGRSCRPRADPAAAGQVTSRGAGPSTRREIPARWINR